MKLQQRVLAFFLFAIAVAFSAGLAQADGARLNQPAASCASTRASVTFSWRPAPGSSQQWLDVSTLDNGFIAGTFESEGPLNGSTASYVWDGLRSGTEYYWRVNSRTVHGWEPSETGRFTPCAATASGVNYVFGTNVSPADQAAVRDAIRVSADYGKEVLGFEPSNYTVHAYQNVDELAEAIARWIADPSPDTIARIRDRYTDPRYVTLGSVVAGDGMFISTWADAWTGSTTFRYLVIAHEYMHLMQAALLGPGGQRGTPTWLYEGSAEYFGILAYTRKRGTTYDSIRATYIRGVDQVTESLLALETSGRFRESVDESYALAMLAFEFLIKEKGWQGFVDYYRAVGGGQHWQAAFTQSFGRPYESFAGAFEAYRQNGYR